MTFEVLKIQIRETISILCPRFHRISYGGELLFLGHSFQFRFVPYAKRISFLVDQLAQKWDISGRHA